MGFWGFGVLARILKEESKLGELLDPIADKILVCSAFGFASYAWCNKKL